MKLLTVTVPCYNSAAYMRRCVDSLLVGGDELDVLLIDDGSTDETGAIADRYAADFPNIVRVIHQANGGHGEGLNQGIRNALGLYFKVVDSDDRLDPDALLKLLGVLRQYTDEDNRLDLIVNDYVYDQVDKEACFSVRYRSVMKPNRVLSWDTVHRFPIHKQFMIHSLIYRTQLLRDMPLTLPKHTFYEDNLYIYQPLPYTKRLYYLDAPLYGYFIGRGDQSINEHVILSRLDQVTKITEQMITSYTLDELLRLPNKLYGYMINNCAGMLSTTSSLQFIQNDEKSLEMNRQMWQRIYDFDPKLYRKLRHNLLGATTVLPGKFGRKVLVGGYRFVRSLIRF